MMLNSRMTRRASLGFAAAMSGAILAACGGGQGGSSGSQPDGKVASPVTLTMLSDHGGPDLDAQKAIFARFSKEQQPNVSFELSPNGPNQTARDRAKIMAQGGTPPDFWESTRAAYADLYVLGIIQPITDYVKRDKIAFEKMFVPD
ncbi:MAG TPA: hypothetical protein VH916_02340, partial [Dehalococcoidia bacterium]